MKITVLTLFPEMINGFFAESIVKRAQENNLVEVEIVNLRDFAEDSHKSVDDKPYGGGAGMILRVDILTKALKNVKAQMSNIKTTTQNSKTILTSAKGKVFNQETAKRYSKLKELVLIAGHYESVDERIMDQVDEEVSLGDFVMTGGEITAAAIVDSIVRLIPGVLKKEEATELESFKHYSINYLIEQCGSHPTLTKLKESGIEEVSLLEHPHYTRPEDFEGKKVPEVLLSGHAAEIEKWRLKMSFAETLKKRPDLLKSQ